MVEPLAESLKSTHELQSQSHPIFGDLNLVQDCSMCQSKKSWADMVEEDEQELFDGRTPRNWSEGLNKGEEFNDENINTNIIHESPTLLNQVDNFSQKIESLDLVDGYYTQPQKADSSMNRTVQRSLSFDHHQKPETAENYHLSPLPKKALSFEGYNSGNDTKLNRRSRLPVFQDITLLSESPRP
ncbi:unnamed protein product [Ilex paraguariensis]